MSFRYTLEQLEFLRTGYMAMQVPELTNAFNKKFGTTKTEQQIKSALTNHKFTCGRKVGNPKGTFLKYTQEQADYLIDNYKQYSMDDLTAAFNDHFQTNIPVRKIRAFTKNHAIRSGRTGQFEKGHKSWNTGMKGLDVGGRSVKTRFKKGNRPQTWVPIGSERISSDGYLRRKITDTGYCPRDWVGVHILIWQEYNGSIPDGHTVIFKDGDKTNIHIDNLELLSRAELLYLNRNGYRDLPTELKPSMVALAKLVAKKFQLEKPNRKTA